MSAKHGFGFPAWDEGRRNALLLLLVAAFLLWASWTGRVARCVAPRYAWMTPFGAFFVALMGAAAWRRGRTACDHDQDHDHDHDHGHDHGTGGCGCGHGEDGWGDLRRAVIALPFLLAVVVDPARLTPEGLRKRQIPESVSTLQREDRLRRTLEVAAGWTFARAVADEKALADGGSEAGALLDANVRDISRRIRDGAAGELVGRYVSLIGQVEPYETPDGPRFDLVRLVVVCCIADATAVGLPVVPLPGTTLVRGQWVRVAGVLAASPDGVDSLILEATSVERIPEPGYPYL